MDIHLNSEPVKYAIIALSFPLWAPFAKALWQEFNDSLRDEGGIFGEAPTAAELAAIERERGRFRSSLVSVTHEEQERIDGASPAASRSQAPGRPAALSRARGFRAR